MQVPPLGTDWAGHWICRGCTIAREHKISANKGIAIGLLIIEFKRILDRP